jgi:hypothetical protein
MRKFICVASAVAAMIFFSAVCFAEKLDFPDAEFVFVEARGTTGYYVDMNSVRFTGDHEVDARVEIIKASENRMFFYSVHFDRQKRTYQILDSLNGQYDTKEKTGGSMVPLKETGYASGSPMEGIVEYIYSPQP